MSLTQDAVIKLVLNHIGGTKIRGLGPKTLVAQGREVIVKALPYKNLVAKLRELAGNLDVRDVFLQNPLAQAIVSVENRLSDLKGTIEDAVNLPNEIKDQVTAAIDSAMGTVENMALHSSILSGTDIPNAFSGIEQSIEDAIESGELAQTAATAAQQAAATAVALYSQLGDDGILSAVEKRQVVLQYTSIVDEEPIFLARAATYGITTEATAYSNAIDSLTTYLATLTTPVLWSDTTSHTEIVNFDWQSMWAAVFETRATLIAKIDELAGTTSTWDGVTGAGRPEDGATRNNPKGPWAASTVYAVGDMVSYNGSSYVVNTAHTSTGSFDVTKFYLLSAAGDNGIDGINVATVFLYKRAASTPAVPTTSSTFTFATGVLTGHDNGWTQTVPSGSDPLYVITATAASSSTTDTILTSEWAAPNIMAQDGVSGTNGLSSAIVYLYKRSASAPTVPTTTSTYTFASGVLTGHDNGWTQSVPTSDGNPLYVTLASASSNSATDTIASGEWTAPQIMAQDGADGADGTDGLNVATVYLYKRASSTPAVPTTTSTFTFATGGLSGHDNGWTQTVPGGTDPLYVTTATAASSNATDTIPTGEWAPPSVMAQNGTDGTNGTNGLNNAVVYLYKRSATTPTVPSTTSTYTFASGVLTGHDNGWTQAVPATDGNPLYVTLASASSANTTDTIATGEWTAPQVMAQDGTNGTNGTNGLNVATVYLYKRASSTPAVPSTTSTFTFATGGLADHDNGWTQTVPGGTDPLYVITATAASSSATDTIPTGEWSSPSIMAQNGVAGADGLNSATVYLYKRASSAPAVPTTTSTYTFSTGVLTGHNNDWTQTVPATDGNPLYVIVASAVSSASTDTINTAEWTSPQIMVQDGTNGTNGLNVATVYLYKRAASTPTVPSTTSTFTFATGGLAGHDNGWTQTIPGGTDPLYVITATAASSSATDTIPTGEWSSPNILAQDGTNGTDGLNIATVYLYKRATSTPSVPSTTSTFTFATNSLVDHDNGWTQTIPATNGMPLYVTIASAASAGSTDTIATGEWTTPQIMVQDGADGVDGIDGSNSALVYIYQRGTSAPTLPSATATYTFATGGITGLDNGWSATIPAGTDSLYVSVATASSSGATDTIAAGEWSTPSVLTENGINSASIFLYKRSTSAPAVPSTTSTYTFATGVLTGHDNGWTQSVPSGTDALYLTIATAANTAATDTIATGEWSTPGVIAISGNTSETRYTRSLPTPSTPTGNTPSGWTLGVPSGTDTLWMVTGLKNPSGTLLGVWSTPVALTVADRGPYSSGSTYYINNTTTYSGGTYKALQDNFSGQAPSGTAEATAYWSVVAAPGSDGAPGTPPSSFNTTINLTSGAAVNLRTVADAAGYTGASDATVTFNVPNAVTVEGLAAGGLGIDSGNWPTGSYSIALTLVVQNGGIVHGGPGGAGAGGVGLDGGSGGPGGDAIYCRLPMTITIDSGGIVRGGGGGGGGGGGAARMFGPLGEEELQTATGGDGGLGFPTQGSGSAAPAGAGGDGGGGGAAATAGSAGSPGDGSTGGTQPWTNYSGGGGGAAGYAVRKNGHAVTVTNNGTMTGTSA